MDIHTIGKLNDWTLFTYKILFGLISRKDEICWTLKANASYILISSVKSCWAYTINLHPLILHRLFYKTVSRLMIQSNTSTFISKYVRKNLYIFFLSSGGYSFTINYLEDKMRHGMWVYILLSNLASSLTTRVLIF